MATKNQIKTVIQACTPSNMPVMVGYFAAAAVLEVIADELNQRGF